MMASPKVIFLMGPTASGKTRVALDLVQRIPAEIISVDSALVYRGMDIGTAKPDPVTLARVPHHLINIIDPTDTYSAAAFRRDALKLIHEIIGRGKIPLLVGGTMLYFKALRDGLSDLPQSDPKVRAAIQAEVARHGIERLHGKLAAVDMATASRLKRTDTQRIQRALEIYYITGKPMSELLGQGRDSAFPFQIIPLALLPSDRSHLHSRIATRFSGMVQTGLIDELRMLKEAYNLNPDLPSMRCVGYRQAWQFLAGEIAMADFLDKGIAATRQLAKRQITWLRAMQDIIEVDCLARTVGGQVLEVLKQFF
jgi:tRNA dimethylallyltransferase